MKPAIRMLGLVALAVLMITWEAAHARSEPADDRTRSPYFFVNSGDPALDRLPMKSTSASVRISGVIADVLVAQLYKNEGRRPIEAVYVFPASTRAAVYGMKMTIGKRVVEAKIRKRDEARRDYEKARGEGRSASLLEQHRPNVFQMSVANIMPGDEIRVEMRYTELIVPTDRVYEFVFPAVVGPRYTNQAAERAPAPERWVQNPTLHEGEAPTYAFDITVDLSAGIPIRELASPSHKVKTVYGSPSSVQVSLDPAESRGGNRDYILRYRLDGDRIQSGLLLCEGKGENFFLLMLQPPGRIAPSDIPGREYLFIVDVSGSMHGFPLEISKMLMADLLGNLRPSDRFNVLLFSGGSSVLAEESVPATRENIARAVRLIDRQRGGGGTELLPALRRALSLKKAEGTSRTVAIVTDGYVTVEEEAFDLIRDNLGHANVFAFGIGTSVNRHLIEGMARAGMGEPFVVTKPAEAQASAEKFRSMIQSPVLTQVKVAFRGFEAYDVEPLTIPDVFAERPVLVFGKWRGKAKGAIVLSGMSGNGRFAETLEAGSVKPSASNAALRYLWARHRIALLSDYNRLRAGDKRTADLTELGLRYNLLTATTSFVAIDSQARNADGTTATVRQPLPLPRGVSDHALGGNAMKARGPLMATAVGEAAPACGPALTREKRANAPIADAAVSGNLSKTDLLEALDGQRRNLEACLAGARGKLVVRLTVNPDGTVKGVRVLSGTLTGTETAQCIVERLKKIRLPAARDGKEGRAVVTVVCGS
ncbi:MAG: Vault protein inter-alpha-trypsin [Syntrophaceae bacterium PtaB.Bin038]|nr:MAG: Vault protein inter-alpha-trypsin [Syntrophaceae bacterium PtaB.Bin038]